MFDLFDLLKLFIKFCWFKDTETACCLIITLAYWLDEADIIQMRDYFKALEENNAYCKSLRDPK